MATVSDRFKDIETRVKAIEVTIEAELPKIKTDIHTMKNEAMNVRSELTTLRQNSDDILIFVSGANKVFGLAKRHWKTAIVFGAGIMTSAGIGNQDMWRYIGNFFG